MAPFSRYSATKSAVHYRPVRPAKVHDFAPSTLPCVLLAHRLSIISRQLRPRGRIVTTRLAAHATSTRSLE